MTAFAPGALTLIVTCGVCHEAADTQCFTRADADVRLRRFSWRKWGVCGWTCPLPACQKRAKDADAQARAGKEVAAC